MERTTPVHSGYQIVQGAGLGRSGSKIDVWAEYLVESQDIANNKSFVRAYFYAALREGQTSSTKYASGLSASFAVNGAAGTGVENGAYDFSSARHVHTLGSFAGVVAHEPDGTGVLHLVGSFSTRSSYIAGGSLDVQETLPAIARLSGLSAPASAEIGGRIEIGVTAQSADYAHCATLRLGAAQQRVDLAAGEGSASLSLPMELCAQTPDAAEAAATITLETFLGETRLGEVSRAILLSVPAAVVPTAGTLTLSRIDGEVPADWGVYVQGKSRVRAALSGAAGARGSRVVYTLLSGGGSSLRVEQMETAPLLTAGEVVFTAQVQDSRGRRSEEVRQSVTVLPYAAPKLSDVTWFRAAADGTADGEGEHLFVRFAAEVSSCGGHNAGTAVLRYRPVGSETWTTSAALATGADNLLAGFSIGRRYELSLELSDAFSTSSFAGELSTAERIVHFRADGKGLALGKMSEKPGLEVAWAADFAKAPTVAGTALLDLIYPVGSIYMSMQNASPAETLGGTWEAITGAFLLPGEQSGQTGGSRTHQHAFGVCFHPYYGALVGENEAIGVSDYAADGTISWQAGGWDANVDGVSQNSGLSSGTGTATVSRQKAMGTTSFAEHMPPYLTVYAWQRTA